MKEICESNEIVDVSHVSEDVPTDEVMELTSDSGLINYGLARKKNKKLSEISIFHGGEKCIGYYMRPLSLEFTRIVSFMLSQWVRAKRRSCVSSSGIFSILSVIPILHFRVVVLCMFGHVSGNIV